MTDMTIKAVRTTMLRVPWPETPWLKGHAFGDARNLLVLEVETKGGIVGMGYLFSFRPGLKTVVAALEETILPHVIGKDATAVEGIWTDLWKRTVTYNRGGIVTMAMSALDIALWDAIGKRANMPLHRLWGHVRSELPVYGSGCFRGSGGDGMIAKALHYKQQGYKAIKMQMAHTSDLRADVDNVKRMREALGPDIAIMIDINQGWTADVAINQGRKIVDHDIYWLEEPVPADDFKGYVRVAQALPIRIVGGETHFTRYDLRPFFENPCCPILQPDPMRGGYTDLRKISVLADTWGLQMAPHLFPELNVQLLASIPNGAWIEDMGLSEDLWVEPVKVDERHDQGARAAGAWLGVQAGDSEGLQSVMTNIVTEEMMVPSEPGIEIFVRNKRPANLKSFTPETNRAVRARLDLSGAHRLRHPARRAVVDGLRRLARQRRLLPRRARLWPLDAAEGDGRAGAEQSAGVAHAGRGEGRHGRPQHGPQAAQHPAAQPARLVVGLRADGDHHDPESGQGRAPRALRAGMAAHHAVEPDAEGRRPARRLSHGHPRAGEGALAERRAARTSRRR